MKPDTPTFAPSDTPLKGLVFFLDPDGWGRDGVDCLSLRTLGAKVLNRAASTVTHATTMIPPAGVGQATHMSAKSLARWRLVLHQVRQTGREPVQLSSKDLEALIGNAFAARSAARQDRLAAEAAATAAATAARHCATRLQLSHVHGMPDGFVGI